MTFGERLDQICTALRCLVMFLKLSPTTFINTNFSRCLLESFLQPPLKEQCIFKIGTNTCLNLHIRCHVIVTVSRPLGGHWVFYEQFQLT